MKQRYLVIFEKGMHNYSGFAPDFPGCYSVGDTLPEMRANMNEAIDLYLEYVSEKGLPIPAPLTKQFLLPLEGDDAVHSEYVTEWLDIEVPEVSRPEFQTAA